MTSNIAQFLAVFIPHSRLREQGNKSGAPGTYPQSGRDSQAQLEYAWLGIRSVTVHSPSKLNFELNVGPQSAQLPSFRRF